MSVYRLSLTVKFTDAQWTYVMAPLLASAAGGGWLFVARMQKMAREQHARTGLKQLIVEGTVDVDTWFKYRDYPGGGGFEKWLGRGPTQAVDGLF